MANTILAVTVLLYLPLSLIGLGILGWQWWKQRKKAKLSPEEQKTLAALEGERVGVYREGEQAGYQRGHAEGYSEGQRRQEEVYREQRDSLLQRHHREMEEARERALQEGADQGYRRGVTEGKLEEQQAHLAALEEARQKAEERGRQAGYDAGYRDGINQVVQQDKESSLTTAVETVKEQLSVVADTFNLNSQGRWGEIALAQALERLGGSYDLQATMEGDNSRTQRPDAVYTLRSGTKVVIDSKALTLREPKSHLASIRKTMDDLAKKNYPNSPLLKDSSFGGTLLFLPSDGLLQRLYSSGELMDLVVYGVRRNVLLVTPTTLTLLLTLLDSQYSIATVERDYAVKVKELAEMDQVLEKVEKDSGDVMKKIKSFSTSTTNLLKDVQRITALKATALPAEEAGGGATAEAMAPMLEGEVLLDEAPALARSSRSEEGEEAAPVTLGEERSSRRASTPEEYFTTAQASYRPPEGLTVDLSSSEEEGEE